VVRCQDIETNVYRHAEAPPVRAEGRSIHGREYPSGRSPISGPQRMQIQAKREGCRQRRWVSTDDRAAVDDTKVGGRLNERVQCGLLLPLKMVCYADGCGRATIVVSNTRLNANGIV